MKRFRKPKLKGGELRVYWGKVDGEGPDVVLDWRSPALRGDSLLLYNYICTKSPDTSVKPLFSKMRPSLIEELEARGYDITTLRFSIMKKAAK